MEPNYREIYDSAKEALEYHIIQSIGSKMAFFEKVKFKKEEQFEYKDTVVIGMHIDEHGMFVDLENSSIEVSENDECFMEFLNDPYNIINLNEALNKTVKKT